MAKQFFVDEEDIEKISDNEFKMYGKEINHIRVLRYKVNDDIIINNNSFKIKEILKDSILVIFNSKLEKNGEPNINITVFQAFLKSDKMDFLIQKQVELGAKRIIPFISENVVVKLDEQKSTKKCLRFNKIAVEACKQCGRTDEAYVDEATNLNLIKNSLNKYDFVIFAYELETNSLNAVITNIKAKVNNASNIAIIIGPEGGFTKMEATALKEINNVYSVSLGKRILRAETAALNLLSIITYEFDNIDIL